MTRDRYHHGDLRQALVHAALELLEEGELPSLRAVARHAGVSAGAPYHHFADKNALLAAVAMEGYRQLQDQIEALFATAATPEEELRGALRSYLVFAMDHPALYRVMVNKELEGMEQVHDAGKALMAMLVARIAAHLGREPLDPEIWIRAVSAWSGLHGMATLYDYGVFDEKPVPLPREALVQGMVEGLVRELVR